MPSETGRQINQFMAEKKIRENPKIHNKNQLEIKQIYTFNPEKSNTYHVKTYFFLPTSFRIDESNYTETDFFTDMNSYIRFKIPNRSLDYLLNSPGLFRNLKLAIAGLSDKNNKKELINSSKIFVLKFKKAMKNSFQEIVTGKDKPHEIDKYLEIVDKLQDRFIEVMDSCDDIDSHLNEELSNTVEYMMMKVLSRTGKIYIYLKENEQELFSRYREKLISLISKTTRIMKEKNFITPDARDPRTGREYITKQGHLKKEVSSPLFLDTIKGKSGVIVTHLLYSLAAGIAMVFATSVAFMGQSRYGSLSIPFFLALIISYMFKDRIKDLLKFLFTQSINDYLYDRVRRVYYRMRYHIGLFKESFSYVDNGDMPEAIEKLRGKGEPYSPGKETVMLYRKYLKLSSRKIKKADPLHLYTGIIDMLRYNLQHLTRNIDTPEKEYFTLEDGIIRETDAQRIYTMNVISHYKWGKNDHYQRLKIDLTSDGIVDISSIFMD